MCTDSRSWDVKVLADLFNKRDQRCILNVHLSSERDKDCLYWNNEVSGVYSVRSAYRMLRLQKGKWEDSYSEGIWKIKTPSKVLIYAGEPYMKSYRRCVNFSAYTF